MAALSHRANEKEVKDGQYGDGHKGEGDGAENGVEDGEEATVGGGQLCRSDRVKFGRVFRCARAEVGRGFKWW